VDPGSSVNLVEGAREGMRACHCTVLEIEFGGQNKLVGITQDMWWHGCIGLLNEGQSLRLESGRASTRNLAAADARQKSAIALSFGESQKKRDSSLRNSFGMTGWHVARRLH